ncbi:MAG: hypothetical protein AAFR81_14950 [Chloroflexota bacterium]
MRRRWIVAIAVLVILVIASVFTATTFAPETSEVGEGAGSDALACVTNTAGDCLQMPVVSGIDVNSEPVSYPDDFDAPYQLVAMPFDQEQQVEAITWYELFQDLADDDARVDYWSIAALPELNAAIRLLVIGGIRAGVNDPDVQARIAILFLEDQASFLDALDVPNTDTIRAYIMDDEGTVYYVAEGAYTEASGEAFSEALAQLLGSDADD